MRNIVYTARRSDMWVEDVESLIRTLGVFWMVYKFELDHKDDGAFDIVVVDNRVEPTESALISFKGVCEIITLAIQIWIEGYTIGKF